MKAYIWDLDGTLINSYPGILSSLMNVLKDYAINLNKEEVYEYILKKSVHEFLKELSNTYSISIEDITLKYSIYRRNTQYDVTLMPYAKETLAKLKELGYQNIIYTHKGRSTIEILKKLEIASYFYDVITKENGFKRKPDPEGILYILNKYNIEKEEAIYIGDRPLDLLCAKNAGIKSILYSPKDSPIDFEHPHKIRDLKEIIE